MRTIKSYQRIARASTLAVATLWLSSTAHSQVDDLLVSGQTIDPRNFVVVDTGSVSVRENDQISVRLAHVEGGDMQLRVKLVDERGRIYATDNVDLDERATQKVVFNVRNAGRDMPDMLRVQIDGVGPCGDGSPGGFVARAQHQSAANGAIDSFATCPVPVCSGPTGHGRHAYFLGDCLARD